MLIADPKLTVATDRTEAVPVDVRRDSLSGPVFVDDCLFERPLSLEQPLHVFGCRCVMNLGA